MERGTLGGKTATRFTALELAAAEQLVHLSESSCSHSPAGAGAAAFSHITRGGASASSASASFSSSPRSVNAPAAQVVGGVGDDDDAQEVGGCSPRRNRRYRPITEIYGVTEPPASIPGGARRRKEKDHKAAAAAAAGGREDSQRRRT